MNVSYDKLGKLHLEITGNHLGEGPWKLSDMLDFIRADKYCSKELIIEARGYHLLMDVPFDKSMYHIKGVIIDCGSIKMLSNLGIRLDGFVVNASNCITCEAGALSNDKIGFLQMNTKRDIFMEEESAQGLECQRVELRAIPFNESRVQLKEGSFKDLSCSTLDIYSTGILDWRNPVFQGAKIECARIKALGFTGKRRFMPNASVDRLKLDLGNKPKYSTVDYPITPAFFEDTSIGNAEIEGGLGFTTRNRDIINPDHKPVSEKAKVSKTKPPSLIKFTS